MAAATVTDASTATGFVTQFEDRQGIYQFQEGTEGYGYLPQVNEWAQRGRYPLEWICIRVGGQAHAPEFSAYPKWCNQDLVEYTARANTKQKAKEASAKAMALSGHC